VNKKLSLKKLDVGWPSSREYHELVWGILAAEHETPDKLKISQNTLKSMTLPSNILNFS